ncbi:hypothetical protein K0M31_001486, partial [Melipona bicolor]
RTQPARRADGEKEEEVAVVEEAVEKERRLNRRPERKVREATPAPANININNNTNTNTNATTTNNNNNSRSAARCIGGAGAAFVV